MPGDQDDASAMLPAAAQLTPQRIYAALKGACDIAGFDSAEATHLRSGENVMYHLPRDGMVLRIGRSIPAAAKEVLVSAWLADNGFPAATVPDAFRDGPIVVDDTPVTIWDYIEESGPAISSAEFGEVLRGLHSVPWPTEFQLPAFSPMPKVDSRLNELTTKSFPDDELAFLRQRFEQLSAEWDALTFELPPGPIHGDAHPGNLMRSTTGPILVIDLEDFCIGPREWDASVMSVRHRAFGWASEEEYRRYVDAYGYDPLRWDGFPVMRAVRELNMTTWLAQRYEDPAVADEVLKRVSDLRDDQALRDWRQF